MNTVPLVYQKLAEILAVLHCAHIAFFHTDKAELWNVTVNNGYIETFQVMEIPGQHDCDGGFADPIFLVADCNG